MKKWWCRQSSVGVSHFLDLLWVRYNSAKFHRCRICVTDFREGEPFCPPTPLPHPGPALKMPILNSVKEITCLNFVYKVLDMALIIWKLRKGGLFWGVYCQITNQKGCQYIRYPQFVTFFCSYILYHDVNRLSMKLFIIELSHIV